MASPNIKRNIRSLEISFAERRKERRDAERGVEP